MMVYDESNAALKSPIVTERSVSQENAFEKS